MYECCMDGWMYSYDGLLSMTALETSTARHVRLEMDPPSMVLSEGSSFFLMETPLTPV